MTVHSIIARNSQKVETKQMSMEKKSGILIQQNSIQT